MEAAGWIRAGAVLGFLAVGLGAFGAHALKAKLESAGLMAPYQTAVQYHFYHALALVLVGLLSAVGRSGPALSVAGWSFLVGIGLFSGSLYALAISGQTRLGIITPFGGLAMLAGWAALAVAAGAPARGGV